MPSEQASVRGALETFAKRLIESVGRGPLLKAFPTRAIKRIDLARLRLAAEGTPERLVQELVKPQGELLVRFERFSEGGRGGDERRALFAVLHHRLEREARLVLRETGLRTLWLAYPLLYAPDPAENSREFLLAPLVLWPLRIQATRSEGEVVLARDKDGGAPRWNRVATAWLRRTLDFEPAEPSSGDIREVGSLDDLDALCRVLADSFRPPLEVTLRSPIQSIPSRDALAAERTPAILNSGLVGLIQWENQELIQDLETLVRAQAVDGAAADIVREPSRPVPVAVPVPDERDRYLVTDTDASQERAVWMARDANGVVVHGPPGTGKSQVIVNVVADALAHGQTVLVVCQKKAALDVVSARLRKHGLDGLCLQIDDAEADRRRVIETLQTQRRPAGDEKAAERDALAASITRLEAELDAYRRALFDDEAHAVSYRWILGRLARLGPAAPNSAVPGRLRQLLSPLAYRDVQRLARLLEELEAAHDRARPEQNPWRQARPDVGAAPDELRAIAAALERAQRAASEADTCALPDGRPLELCGDLAAIAEAAATLRTGLPGWQAGLARPPLAEGSLGGARLEDGPLRDAAEAFEVLARWQPSWVRALAPAYHRARRQLRRIVAKQPWLADPQAGDLLARVERRARALLALRQALTGLAEWLTPGAVAAVETASRRGEAVVGRLDALREWLPRLPPLVQWLAMLARLTPLERDVVDALLGDGPPAGWSVAVEMAALRAWARAAEQAAPALLAMSPQLYEARRRELADALARKRALESTAILASWGRHWDRHDLRWRQGLALRGRASPRIREIVEARRSSLMVLRPCWLMNPGTVSQVFPLQPGLFDLVVFDEASQCPPEYAVPALHRARRAVVAGDAKQLPPTMFFKSTFDFDEDEEDPFPETIDPDPQAPPTPTLPPPPGAGSAGDPTLRERQAFAVTTGTEDLLALAQARLPEAHLNVHYRSLDPRLIAFSNAAFYGGRLQLPQPAAPIRPDGLPPLAVVPVDGRYTTARVNAREADAVVEYVRALWAGQEPSPTLGIVTFNEPQEQLILDRIEEVAGRDRAFGDRYRREVARRDDGQDVGFFVKNLETVQGDERDVMVFSTTYGPREDRPFSRAFLGPLNRAGGERRLNVAISRARRWVRIYTSLPIDEIADALVSDTVPTGPGVGRAMLQLYLCYADAVTRGEDEAAKAVLARATRLSGYVLDPAESRGGEESEFEIAVADRLRRLGYRVDPQVGSGAFRIDLAVRHPDDPDAYVLGIECDGRAYHAAPAARAYDLWRQRILEERGWRIHRIWSTAWRLDPEAELEGIEERIRQSLRDHGVRPGSPFRFPPPRPIDRLPGDSNRGTVPSEAGATPNSGPTDGSSQQDRGDSAASSVSGSRAGSPGEAPPAGPDRKQPDPPGPTGGSPLAFGSPAGGIVARGPSPARRRSPDRDPLAAALERRLPEAAWTCPECGWETRLWFGRRGPFLKCGAPSCGKTSGVDRAVLAAALDELAVRCHQCGQTVKAVAGPFGQFVGCSSYPRCQAHRSWRDLREQLRGRREPS